MIKYPEIEVNLDGISDRYLILGEVSNAMRDHNIPEMEIHEFYCSAICGNNEFLINVCSTWVTIT